MTILTRKLGLVFLLKFSLKNHLLNMMNFQGEMVHLFCLQKEALKSKSVKTVTCSHQAQKLKSLHVLQEAHDIF